MLILDEPTVGLDPRQIIEVREVIRSLGQKHTVILSSHILPEVQEVCDRILVIDRGKIVADGTPAELSERVAGASGSPGDIMIRVSHGPPRRVRRRELARGRGQGRLCEGALQLAGCRDPRRRSRLS